MSLAVGHLRSAGHLGPERYQYDGVSRAVRGTLGSGSYQNYTFDRFGNLGTIYTLRDSGSETRAYAIDPATNRLINEAYDADGNQLTYGAGGLGFTYTWDPLSKMKSSRRNNGSQNEFYVYTADDERLYTYNAAVSPAEETWTLRDLDGKVLRTWGNVVGSGGTWSHEKDHIYRDGQLLASWSPTDGPRYYHLDHLGTPRLTTNQFGRHADSAAYFPFGEQAGLEVPSDEKMRFTGHERDQHGPGQLDDLDYMHQRYCNPMTGRFLSVDPVGGNPRNPQSWNRYAYVINNPMKWVDPQGLKPASMQGRNAFEDAINALSALFSSWIHKMFSDGENPEEVTDNPNSQAAQLEAEGIDSSALPSERGKAYHDSFIEANSIVGATFVIGGATVVEQLAVNRAVAVLRPGGRLIGTEGSSKSVRILTGGEQAAEKLFKSLTRGGRTIHQSSGVTTKSLAPGVKIGYRPASTSGPPTIDVKIPGLGIEKVKFMR